MKKISECRLEEIKDSPMNMYLYATLVLKDKLPFEYHSLMEQYRRERPEDEMVKGYFAYASSKDRFFNRMMRFFNG